MTHNCRNIEERLVDLVFADASEDERQRTLAEIAGCASCGEQYQALRLTLERFDEATDLMQPQESYWPGYEARLRARLIADERPTVWQRFRETLSSLAPRPAWAVSFAALVLMALLLWTWVKQPGNNVSEPPQQAQTPPPTVPAPEPQREKEEERIVRELPKENKRGYQQVKSPNPSTSRRRGTEQQLARQVDNGRREAADQAVASVPVFAAGLMPSSTMAAIVNEETQQHFEKSQIFLRSFRNLSLAGKELTAAIAGERQRSRSLLFQNIVLRREAEMKGNLPVEQVLNDLEPVLIDIANLPDHVSAGDVRTIRSRIQRKAIITTLQTYSVRPTIASATTD